MKSDERFEQLWTDYLEGELEKDGLLELQQLLASDENFLTTAADSFQVHRLLGLQAENSESRHEEFVRATMSMLPLGENRFVDSVMRDLPSRKTKKAVRYTLLLGAGGLALAFICLFSFLEFYNSTGIARVTGLHGVVQWTGEGGIVQEIKSVGHKLHGGTLESLSADSWAELQFRDGSIVTVSGRSLLTVSDREQKVVRLRYGNVSADVAPQAPGLPMLVHTPSADLSILGTQFTVDAQAEATRLIVTEGRVFLKRILDGKEIEIAAQQEITASSSDDNRLVPLPRADAVTAWQSDLKSEVVFGKWVPDLTALALRLKREVATGQIEKNQAITIYKQAASLDNAGGSVWATPISKGSLIVISVSPSMAKPVILTPDSQFRVIGRLHSEVDIEFGISVNAPEGGFSGKYSVTVSQSKLRGDKDRFELLLPIQNFQEITSLGNLLVGQELRDWWCVSETNSTKLEILSVELVEE